MLLGGCGFTVRHEIAQNAERTGDAANAVNQLDDIAAALLAAELFGNYDVAVAGKAWAGRSQAVLIHQPARYFIQQQIVADADDIGLLRARNAADSFARDFTADLLFQQFGLLFGQRDWRGLGIGHRTSGQQRAGAQPEGNKDSTHHNSPIPPPRQ